MNIEFDYSDLDLGTYYYNNKLITINPNNINREHNDYNTYFYTLLLHVINHEFLHHVLYIEHDKNTSNDFDNLTHDKQSNKDIWEYWLS